MTVNDGDNNSIAAVALRMQGRKTVARIVRLIGSRDLPIHRLRRGSGSDGRQHRRQGQGTGRGQNG